MDKRVSVSEESINDLIKHLQYLITETYGNIDDMVKSIDNAEMEGWNDNKFIEFKDDFLNAERMFKQGLRHLEDSSLSNLRRIKMIIEQY